MSTSIWQSMALKIFMFPAPLLTTDRGSSAANVKRFRCSVTRTLAGILLAWQCFVAQKEGAPPGGGGGPTGSTAAAAAAAAAFLAAFELLLRLDSDLRFLVAPVPSSS